MAHLLIVDDEATLARNVATFFERAGHSTALAGSLGEAEARFRELNPDAVVLDYQLPDGTGLTLVERVRRLDAHCPLLLITGHGSIELAVQAMKAGADDFLTKPFAMAELRRRVELLLQRSRQESRLQYLEARSRESSSPLLGDSAGMVALRDRIGRLAQAARQGAALPPILITGETGVGKELVARACHDQSLGPQAPFVELNCAAIPGQLLESELFGHERGAFTDAKERKIGLMEAADGGSLFLDELGEMDLALQAKLLKVLEDGRFRRVGALAERQVQVRILAATNQDLQQAVAAGRFRADLYFRLRVLPLPVPPLREREGDVLLLAHHFLAHFARRYRRSGLHFSAAALQALQAHAWPGNVRELRNVVEQAVLLALGPGIERAELLLPQAPLAPAQPPAEPAAAAPGLAERPGAGLPGGSAWDAASAGGAEGAGAAGSAGSALDRMEREALVKALQEAGDNVSQAARALGISRDTLRYRIEKHGLRVQR